MSAFEETLNNLVSISTNIASIEFKKGSTELASDLIQRKKLVRDTDANENKLAALCMGGSLLNKISDITKNAGSDDIVRILRSANALNQICQNQELKERIERLASLHEERVFNLTYLNSTTEKYEQEIDILTTRNTEQNMNINEQEEEEVIKLENELNRKKEETYLLNRKKQDHIKMRNDIKQLKLKNSTNVNYKKRIENIERLENDIHAKKKRIHDYNDILTTMDQDSNVVNNIQTMSSTREIYTGFRARIEKLITSQPIVKDKENNIKELISLFKSIQTELKEILEGLSVIQSTETYVNTTRSIYKGILTYIQKVIESENTTNTIDLEQFNSLIQHNTHTTIPTLEVSKEAIIITPILLKLFNEKQVKLSALTTFVEELAKKHNLTERQAIQSIYKLVAADLVVIDRTHKDSLVKLKLLL